MKDYGTTYSSERPEEVDVKSTKVFVASDIKEETFSCIGEGNGNPLQYFCLVNPRDRGA